MQANLDLKSSDNHFQKMSGISTATLTYTNIWYIYNSSEINRWVVTAHFKQSWRILKNLELKVAYELKGRLFNKQPKNCYTFDSFINLFS